MRLEFRHCDAERGGHRRCAALWRSVRWTAGLCLIGERQENFNMTAKDCLRIVWEGRWVKRMRQQKGKRALLATMLLILGAGGTKCLALETADIRMEFGTSGLYFRESGEQRLGYVFFPSFGWRIDAEKSGKDGRPEFRCSVTESDVALYGERTQDSDKSDDDVNVPTHDWFLIALPFFILCAGGAYSVRNNVKSIEQMLYKKPVHAVYLL
ncbi:MAG: hypothetical protein H6R10_3481 [Rhodocyclaceae bacterium]|nr:hypothetical protein [Rhodocyclaceae bacterium]